MKRKEMYRALYEVLAAIYVTGTVKPKLNFQHTLHKRNLLYTPPILLLMYLHVGKEHFPSVDIRYPCTVIIVG